MKKEILDAWQQWEAEKEARMHEKQTDALRKEQEQGL